MVMKTSLVNISVKVLLMLILIIPSISASQTNSKDSFFSDYEKQIDNLRKIDAEVLSPEFYSRAVEYYKEAAEAYDNQESVSRIREKLQKSEEYAQKAEQVVKLAKLTLAGTIETRKAALEANAPLFAEKEWDRAEEYLNDAASNLEDDDVEDARTDGAAAVNFYRKAELLAIKNGILGDARTQIHLAIQVGAEDYCYHTLRNAQNLLAETEELLETNRYAKDEAITTAMQTAYEGRHAQFLAQSIKKMSGNQANWEKMILEFEDILISFGEQFKYKCQFDNGFNPSVKAIAAHISNLKAEKDRLLEENAQLEEELMQVREREASTSAELAQKNERERKIEKVFEIFTDQEAKIINEGKRLVIRLYGLTFQPAKAVIQPEYFSLLTKVQRAIYEFPDQYVLIEGHTDSRGNAVSNKILSEKRARAVKEYLVANMDIEDQQIDYYGMGDQKPIASNKTREGRAINRRIEIIISLEK